ncbi:MAG: TonB-dependent receptor [Bacteroidetes bacterium]|nr:TonB-dependent receptor [Bacteroidota bacterium]
MKTQGFLLSLICLFTGVQLLAQSGSISGKITDQENGQPISLVTVKNIQTGETTTSGKSGLFRLNAGEKLPLIIEFSHLGFDTLRVSVDKDKLSIPLTINMTEKQTQLSEVEVFSDLTKSQYPVLHVGITPLERTPQQDIGKFLRSEPNVGGIRKGALGIDPVIRGFKYSQLNVQLNGGTKIEGGCPNRMDPATAHVDINDLKNIAIYKGPYALKYGPAFGGVLRLITSEPEFYETYQTKVSMIVGGQTNYEGFKSRIRVSGGNELLAYSFSANWNKYGDYKAGNGDVMQGASNTSMIKGQIGVQPLKGQKFFLSYDKSQGRNVDFPTLPMDERSDDTEIYDFNYLGTGFGTGINFIQANVYKSDVHHIMDNKLRPFSDTVVAISDITATNTGGRIAINFNVGKSVIEAGSSYESITKDGNRFKTMIMQPNMPTFTEELWNNALINNLGLFAEYQATSSKIDWVASVRLDFNQANSDPMVRYAPTGDPVFLDADTKSNYTNFSFSGGMTWHINKFNKFGIALGKGVRSPDMTERYITLLPVGYDNYDYVGNPKLKPEENHEIEFDWGYQHSRWGNLQAGIFFSFVTNYISAVMVPPSEIKPQTKGVLGVKRFINIDKAYLTGFEFVYSTPEKLKWDASLTAAYTTGINPEATHYIIENGQVTGEETIKNDPLPEIPPLEATVSFNYHLMKRRLSPGIKVRVVAEQNQISKAYYETSTPGFTTVEFLLAYTYSKNLKVYGGISNLFNTNYYEHLNRRIVGSSAPYLEPGRVCYLNLIISL